MRTREFSASVTARKQSAASGGSVGEDRLIRPATGESARLQLRSVDVACRFFSTYRSPQGFRRQRHARGCGFGETDGVGQPNPGRWSHHNYYTFAQCPFNLVRERCE